MSGHQWVSVLLALSMSSIYDRIQTSESRWQQQQIITQATPFADGVACVTERHTPAKLGLSGHRCKLLITGFAVG